LLAVLATVSFMSLSAMAQTPETPPAEKNPAEKQPAEAESSPAKPKDVSAEPIEWSSPKAQQVKGLALDWLKTTAADQAVRGKVEAMWKDTPADTEPGVLFSRLTESVAMVDAEAAKLVELCSADRKEVLLPKFEWLKEEKTHPIVGANLRLLYGRWLVQQLLFDEAAEQLRGLKPDEVVDPASLLFYQAVVHHRLLEKNAGLSASQSLIEGSEHSPQRYVAVARLIRDDLKGLKEDTLDHIARRMEDIERRLDLGRAGPRVRKIEDGVIKSLDKMIKKIEESQQSSSSSSSSSSDNIQSSSPAQDSQSMGGKGPGNVTKRGVGDTAGWGDLPPKEREEALQQIGREFPAHYRDVVEQYFRRLAAE